MIPAGVLSGISAFSGLFGAGLDFVAGTSFNEAAAAGAIHGYGVLQAQEIVTPLLPPPARLPANIAADSYSTVSRFLFNEAASNDEY